MAVHGLAKAHNCADRQQADDRQHAQHFKHTTTCVISQEGTRKISRGASPLAGIFHVNFIVILNAVKNLLKYVHAPNARRAKSPRARAAHLMRCDEMKRFFAIAQNDFIP